MPLPTEPVPVWFNPAAQQWQDADGKPVCQDHAEPNPCPWHTEAPA
jgi:hypothetical protein